MAIDVLDVAAATHDKPEFKHMASVLVVCGLAVLYFLHSVGAFAFLSIPTKQVANQNWVFVSYPALLWRWLWNPHLTIADLLYHIGLDTNAPLIRVAVSLTGCAYLIRSSEHTTLVQNKSKYLSMNPVQDLCIIVGNLDKECSATIRRDRGSRKVANAYSDLLKAFHVSLSPGDEYHRITKDFIGKFGEKIQELRSWNNTSIDLYKWIQHNWVFAVSYASWGDTSPYYVDPTLITDWWAFHSRSPGILFSYLPAWIYPSARFGMAARDRVLQANADYYRDVRLSEDTSTVPTRTLQYVEAGKKWNFDDMALSRLDLSTTLGLFEPPIDASYGLAVNIFSQPDVLAKVRVELEKLVTHSPDGKTMTFHAHIVRFNCPLFLSCFYENVRCIGTAFSIRDITNDFTLGGLELKKGNLAIMCGTPVNHNPEHWPEPKTFKADRFYGITQPENELTRTYRGFGGGAGICGGRNIAPNLVMAAVGSLLLTFDMVPENSEGKWAFPDVHNAQVPEAVTPPRNVGSTRVSIAPRKEYEGMKIHYCDECGFEAKENVSA